VCVCVGGGGGGFLGYNVKSHHEVTPPHGHGGCIATSLVSHTTQAPDPTSDVHCRRRHLRHNLGGRCWSDGAAITFVHTQWKSRKPY
jgi:hypothetical protein